MSYGYRRYLRSAMLAWHSAQVELMGEYSVGRLLRLREYCERTSTVRCLLVLVVTPVPCLVVTLLLEAIPLRPASDGLEHSLALWLRTVGVALVVMFSMLQQCRALIPRLPRTTPTVFETALLVLLGCTAAMFGLACVIGFPLPFTFLTGSPITISLLLLSMMGMWGRFLAENRAERLEFVNYFVVIHVQVGMACVYPAYAYVFNQLSARRQACALALLPIIKLVMKNVLAKLCRKNGDLRPCVVVLNADIYHVLFLSWCMNGSTSKTAIASLVLVDALETVMALHDVNRVLTQVSAARQTYEAPLWLLDEAAEVATSRQVAQQVGNATAEANKHTVNQTAGRRGRVAPTRVEPKNRLHASMQKNRVETMFKGPRISDATTPCRHQPKSSMVFIGSVVAQEPTTSCPNANEGRSREFLRHALRLLYITEFVLLIEYLEVMIPCLYSLYLLVVYQLPNRVFLTNIRDLSLDELSGNTTAMLSYSLLEMASLCVLGFFLHRQMRVSALRQLAFVLESQSQLVQIKLLIWVVFTVQAPLEHYGTDYSFRFE